MGVNFSVSTNDGEKLDYAKLLEQAKKNYK